MRMYPVESRMTTAFKNSAWDSGLLNTDRLAVAGGNKGLNCGCYAHNRHGLQPNLARAGQYGIEKALAAEQFVLDTLDLLDVNRNTGFKAQHVSSVHNQLLTRRKRVFDQLAVHFDKSRAVAGQTLHDKTLSPEQAGAKLLVEVNGQLHALLGCEKCGFLQNKFTVRRYVKREDAAGEA